MDRSPRRDDHQVQTSAEFAMPRAVLDRADKKCWRERRSATAAASPTWNAWPRMLSGPAIPISKKITRPPRRQSRIRIPNRRGVSPPSSAAYPCPPAPIFAGRKREEFGETIPISVHQPGEQQLSSAPRRIHYANAVGTEHALRVFRHVRRRPPGFIARKQQITAASHPTLPASSPTIRRRC